MYAFKNLYRRYKRILLQGKQANKDLDTSFLYSLNLKVWYNKKHTFFKFIAPLLKFFEERGRGCSWRDWKTPFYTQKGFLPPNN